jgi:hypothetical protein
MRTFVISFLIGTAAVLVLLVVGLMALGFAAAAGDWGSFDIASGPIRLFAFERDGTTITTSMGIGVVPVAALAGLVNAGAAVLLRRRARSA